MQPDDIPKQLAETLSHTKQLVDQLRALQAPLDLDKLERYGILAREGSSLTLLKPQSLPEHAKAKIVSVGRRGGKTYVTFHQHNPQIDKLVRQFEKRGF